MADDGLLGRHEGTGHGPITAIKGHFWAQERSKICRPLFWAGPQPTAPREARSTQIVGHEGPVQPAGLQTPPRPTGWRGRPGGSAKRQATSLSTGPHVGSGWRRAAPQRAENRTSAGARRAHGSAPGRFEGPPSLSFMKVSERIAKLPRHKARAPGSQRAECGFSRPSGLSSGRAEGAWRWGKSTGGA